jgi:IPT/TIG domain-containing protein
MQRWILLRRETGMATRTGRTTVMGIGLIALVLITGQTGDAFAADQPTPAKKPKASPEAKAPKAKADKPTFQTAEKAGKPTACFGEAPKIDKLTPDEGKAGDTVTITGTKFGSADCLRGVSFGPGHAATFKIKNETTITTTVPKGGRKGLAIVTVTTASGADSKSFLVK